MKLSEKTIEVLKNFSNINPNLVVSAGSNLKTISEAKNIMASADITETFENGFGIYDLNEFLSAFNLIDNPTLEFTNNAVKIKGDKTQVEYRFANTEILTAPPANVNMPDCNFEFEFTAEQIGQIKKAASALGHPVLSVSIKEDNEKSETWVEAKVCDPNNPTANTFTLDIVSNMNFNGDVSERMGNEYQFLISNLKLINGQNYKVQISNKLISSWKCPVAEYWIALEKTSTIG